MNGIVWPAPYPKSGRTWFRIFLANLLHNGSAPVEINSRNEAPIASVRNHFEDLAGVEAATLLPEDIHRPPPGVCRLAARESPDLLFL